MAIPLNARGTVTSAPSFKSAQRLCNQVAQICLEGCDGRTQSFVHTNAHAARSKAHIPTFVNLNNVRFLFAQCQVPSLSGRIILADDLLVRCLAHRARTALRPSSLLSSGVSLENRTFPPLRPPSLPSATACGFFAFFFAIPYSLSQIAPKKNRLVYTLPLWYDPDY